MEVINVGVVHDPTHCRCKIRGCTRAPTARITSLIRSGRLKGTPKVELFCATHARKFANPGGADCGGEE